MVETIEEEEIQIENDQTVQTARRHINSFKNVKDALGEGSEEIIGEGTTESFNIEHLNATDIG